MESATVNTTQQASSVVEYLICNGYEAYRRDRRVFVGRDGSRVQAWLIVGQAMARFDDAGSLWI